MAQQEYEQSQAIDAPPEEVFAWLSEVGNLPKYLPPVVDSHVVGPSAEGVPGQRIRTTLEYPGEGGGTFDAVGYLAVDERERRMEWGAEAGRDYSGWLTVGNHGEGGSEVVVHLSFGERSAGPDIEERSPEGRDPLAEGVSATLESIRRQIEEGSGKVESPPPRGVLIRRAVPLAQYICVWIPGIPATQAMVSAKGYTLPLQPHAVRAHYYTSANDPQS